MSLRGQPLSVPNAEGVPRLSDVALFLCGKAISSAWSPTISSDSHAAEKLLTWYIKKVAFMHEQSYSDINEFRNKDIQITTIGNMGLTKGSTPEILEGGGEANFSVAFNAICHGLGEKDFSNWQQQKQHQRERSSSIPTVFGFGEHPVGSISPLIKKIGSPVSGNNNDENINNNNTSSSSSSRGLGFSGINDENRCFTLFEELLELCSDIGGIDIRNDIIFRLIMCITGYSQSSSHSPLLSWENTSIEEKSYIILPALSSLFSVFNENCAVHAAGSITRAFSVWMGVSWNCASFIWQSHIAHIASIWLSNLESKISKKIDIGKGVLNSDWHHSKPPQIPKKLSSSSSYFTHGFSSSSSTRTKTNKILGGFYKASEGKQELNIASMYAAMRQICEGRSLNDRSLLELLVQSGCGLQFSDYNVLEYMMMNDQTTRGTTHDTQISHHSILLSITSGVLLYAQFYLSVRSLEAALHCTRMALLVGHQWRSNEFLTMAHYSSFLVHVACQDTPAAAGDIAIMLQLADAASHKESDSEIDENIPRFHAGCLGYMGAALLLLISPGTVDTYLRSVIITGIVTGISISNGVLGGNNNNNNIGSNNAKNSTTGGHSVVVQTIAQTVRHALWLSELESFLDPSSTVVTEIITGIARETMMIIAGHYGVRSSLKPINVSSLGLLLSQLDEEASTRSSFIANQPSILLLRETMRQTAHRALSAQVGTSDASPGAGPFNILHDYLIAVETHYGEDGTNVVKSNFFFVSTYRFMCAMWLRNHGYMKSAYQELTQLSDNMLFFSQFGTDCYSDNENSLTSLNISKGRGDNGINSVDDRTSHIGETIKEKSNNGPSYWPPDHLLLWQYVQFERAQLADYLGYSSTLPEIGETLRRVSSASHFVMGVLYADLISAMMWSQRGNYGGALRALKDILTRAENIGLTLLHAHTQCRQVSVLLACNRWKEANLILQKIQPAPARLERWCMLAELTTRTQLLQTNIINNNEESEKEILKQQEEIVEIYVRRMEACGCFLPELQQEDSLGITLTEKLCLHACIARNITIGREGWDNDVATLTRELQHRHLQEGRWQLMRNSPMRCVCRDVLSGALLQKMLQST